MGWPQVIWVALTAAGITIAILKHGQPQGKHNVWATLIGTAIMAGLLYWGGFFDGMGP